MSISNYLRKIGMRKGNASRSKGRIGSKANKRAASKGVRKHRPQLKTGQPIEDGIFYLESEFVKPPVIGGTWTWNSSSGWRWIRGLVCQDPPFTCQKPWCGYCNQGDTS